VHLQLPVYVKVLDSTVEFQKSAHLLERFKGLLRDKTYGELSGSLFSLQVTPSGEMDDQAVVTAMIDEHKENLEKLGNALETERLKQVSCVFH
jgi:hypothetical protein